MKTVRFFISAFLFSGSFVGAAVSGYFMREYVNDTQPLLIFASIPWMILAVLAHSWQWKWKERD